MNLAGNTILITGGASGIGFALAERFIQAGSNVIICGRREDKLQEAKKQYPGLHTKVCDVANPSERVALAKWVKQEFPKLNVLLNNAGIQRRVPIAEIGEEWQEHQQEVAINLEAPIHLSALLLPLLQQQQEAYIMNVTSGLAFVPGSFAAIYSATKAAMHSFTMSLRHQLSKTSIKVIEIVPPAVNTDLGGAGLHTFGAPLHDFADAIVQGISYGEQEIGYGTSNRNRKASREEIDQLFQEMNSRF
ncbi:SDR family oxidoreductase [uncultured Pontibacter sp.]|uniref:SDR family oxidoreductase n=1 Tax=uncultured Pontibacter sp. TaxID=453356 RepID=UPI00261F3ABA|nr:SDR family oxidoreductase [uncultured Pontibacter sp.]